MAHPNPLERSHPSVYVPLVLLAGLFIAPLVWLFMSSLQSREQVGRVPPEWLPRQHFLAVDGVERRVTAPLPLPGGMVSVRDFSEAKDSAKGAQSHRVPADRVRTLILPVWQNYPAAIRALSAAEADKRRPLGELIGRSALPFTKRGDKNRSITFVTYLANTLLVAVLGVLGTTLSSALVAYGLARLKFRGRNTLFGVTLASMMVPFPVLMVPLYGLFRELGMIGTLLPLWLPTFFGSAFNIFLLRQFFLTVPAELSDAARIDGCSELDIFFRIMLPLAKPALAVVALFHFLYTWNDFLGPFIFLSEPETFTMALGLQQYQSQHGGSEWHLLMAASALLVVPVVVLFFLSQRTFVQGISTTGMGGR